MNTKTRTNSRAHTLTAAAGALTACLTSVAIAGGPGGTGGAADNYDANATRPEGINLTGVVRDFRERNIPGGHPDFEVDPVEGFGLCMGNVAPALDADGKPVFTGEGRKCSAQATDSEGRAIHPRFYNASLGDEPSVMGVSSTAGISSADSFAQWFRNIPGVNMTSALPITLRLDPSTGNYVFDDRLSTQFADLAGFFPVNDKLMGNSQGGNKNFHFTYELSTEFTYHKGAGQMFTFRGDDDVFVFIDGQLVIDIGGIHGAIEQTVHVDRLDWLEDGETYPLNFFFAERHRTQSNFRIETSLKLRTAHLPNSAHLCD